jgi:flagellar hook assembly protein FlgD
MQANVRLLFRNEGGNPGSAGIFDVEGRLVRQLSLQRVTDGLVGAEWDGLDSSGRRVPSGVYFYRYGTSKEGRGRLVVAR